MHFYPDFAEVAPTIAAVADIITSIGTLPEDSPAYKLGVRMIENLLADLWPDAPPATVLSAIDGGKK